MAEADDGFDFEDDKDTLYAVGDGEAQARKLLGNELYDKSLAQAEAVHEAELKVTHAAGNRLNALAFLYDSIGLGIRKLFEIE